MSIETSKSVLYRFYKAGKSGRKFREVLEENSDYTLMHNDNLELMRWVFFSAGFRLAWRVCRNEVIEEDAIRKLCLMFRRPDGRKQEAVVKEVREMVQR